MANAASLDFYSMVKDDLCHPLAEYKPIENGVLQCSDCGNPFRVYEYIARPRPDNVLHSCRLAEAYARETHDYNVPCSIPISDVPGILPTHVVISIRVLQETLQLMRYVNDAFRAEPSLPTPPDSHLLETFLTRYMEKVTKGCTSYDSSSSSNEQRVLNYVLRNVEQLMDKKLDLFDYYYKLLVPYVKEAADDTSPLQPPYVASDMTLAQQWLMELHSSLIVRAKYGMHCLPFDVVHVMIFCYACASNIDVVANAAFDLMARVARGHYFDRDTTFGQAVSKVLRDNVSYKQNTQLHYLLRAFQTPQDLRDSLSDRKFLERMSSLEQLVASKLPHVFKKPMDSSILELAVAKMFPTVLFNNHIDYYAFTMALNHIASAVNRKTGEIPKGVMNTAKQVFDVVKCFMEHFYEFDKAPETIYWTLDVFKAFLASDDTLEQQLNVLSRVVFCDMEKTMCD